MFLVLIQNFFVFCVINSLPTKSEAGSAWDRSIFLRNATEIRKESLTIVLVPLCAHPWVSR